MKHISKDAYLVNDSALVLALASEAKEKKKQGLKVYDATIGMLIDDKDQLSSFSLIDKALKDNVTLNNRKYSPVKGLIDFNDNIKNWIFRGEYKTLDKNYYIASSATMGGTGAISLAFRNYLDKSQEILLPDIGWGNYKAIASQLNRKYKFYKLFDNDHLNIKDIKETVMNSAKKNKRATIIINDPCHNPTGYSIKENEWISLIKFFNEVNKKYPLTLILDLAYFDYSKKPRLYFELINKYKADYLTLIAFSASKSFSVYGLRVGALLSISKDKEDYEDLLTSSTATIRAIWSNPNALAISAINDVIKDHKNFSIIDKHYKEDMELINSRKEKTLEFFKNRIKGNTLPYKEGFFITYKVKDANNVSEKLKKENIYVLPMENKYIRVALCSLNNL